MILVELHSDHLVMLSECRSTKRRVFKEWSIESLLNEAIFDFHKKYGQDTTRGKEGEVEVSGVIKECLKHWKKLPKINGWKSPEEQIIVCGSCGKLQGRDDRNGCDWCPDNTCVSYWEVKVFNMVHRICNCCYTHLKKVPATSSVGQDTQEGEVER